MTECHSRKDQESRIKELEREVAALKEKVVEGDNYWYALQTLNIRIRDAVEEAQARFEDSLVCCPLAGSPFVRVSCCYPH